MKNAMIYLIYSLGILFASCEKEPQPPPKPPAPNSSKLQIVWQKPIAQDTTENWVIMQEARDGKVLYSRKMPYPATVQARDADSGDIKWIFNDFLSPADGLYDIYIYENNVVFQEWGDTYCLDFDSGVRKWSASGTTNIPRGNQIGDYFYTNHTIGSSPNVTSNALIRTRAQGTFSGWDTLYTRHAVPDSFPIINIPTLWVNSQGDSVIIFLVTDGYNGPPPTAGRFKAYITALNLRTRQIIWQYPDFKGYYSAPPLVDGDRLYINGPDVFCFDLNTGNLLWQKPFEGGVGGTSLVVHHDILVVQSSQIGMWGINKYTGDQIWHNKDTDGKTWELLLFDGIVYCTSSGYGRLYAVNAETGATIWKERSPNRTNPKTGNASFASAGVAIDPERRLLYTADKYYVMCIKLPER